MRPFSAKQERPVGRVSSSDGHGKPVVGKGVVNLVGPFDNDYRVGADEFLEAEREQFS